MTNFLQTAGTKAKQKKVQEPKPKNGENTETNDTYKPKKYCGSSINITQLHLAYMIHGCIVKQTSQKFHCMQSPQSRISII